MDRMQELINRLNEASKAYYSENREIMSNYEYDALYDELLELEKSTGIVLSSSPTQKVGYEVLSELPKIEHEKPMLSLDKTKSVSVLKEWLGDNKGILSFKLDGLTVVLSYREGELVRAVTRGNGMIGEVVTGNARMFRNVPMKIPYKGELTLRGEAVIRYSDFERINRSISDAEAKYKNPRNLCSGSVRQLDPAVTKERHVHFFAFGMVTRPEGIETNMQGFEFLKAQGFDVVDHQPVCAAELADAVAGYSAKMQDYDIPSDGLVLLLDDISYGDSLGTTAKFPRNAIAFKWSDDTYETILQRIEWSPSRTGLINPVAVFEPVEIDGTTVSRASVHNVSTVENLQLGIGDTITVYKANMIIPQIAENLTRTGFAGVPAACPACGGRTVIRQEGDVKTLFCINEDCPVKRIKSYALLASRDAMNIEGLSEATLEKLMGAGIIHEYADLFRLESSRDRIATLDGFGEKSADKLIAAAKKASRTTVSRFIYSLGIPGIGAAGAGVLNSYFHGDFEAFRASGEDELKEIEGIGPVLAKAVCDFFRDEKNSKTVDDLLSVTEWEQENDETSPKDLTGQTFVITGALNHFANRSQLEQLIRSRGGKTASSVSAKTTFLINNDTASTSAKNRKAEELGIPVISEEDFLTNF